MKKLSQYIIITAFTFIAFASCKKDLLKINTDPNAVSVDQFDPNNLLSATQLFYTGSSDDGAEVEETEIFGAGCFIQHWASTSGIFYGDKYLFSTGGFGSYFDHVYTDAVKDVVDLYTTTKGKPENNNLHQISRIMKALVFERITDVYGDVPYFDAGQAYHKSIYFPKYDKQQDIYTDLLKEVSQAVDSLNTNGDRPVGDMFYSSASDQIHKWKQFGNTLLLRIAMRLTKVDPATAKTYVQKLMGHTMTGNDDNAIVYHGTNDPLTINRIYRGIGEDGDVQLSGQISKTFIDFLKNNNDPRLPVFSYKYPKDFAPGDDPSGGSSAPKDQHGLPNGYNAGSGANSILNYPGYLGSISAYSRPSQIIFNPTAPTLVLTYAQSEFLLADAAARWGIGGVDSVHYHNGVVAAITELSAYGSGGAISTDDAEAYYAAHPLSMNNDTALSQINTQYWAETFFNEYEAWSNYRRTGYPALTPVTYPGSQSLGAIPRRMEYSTVDKQVNTANYDEAVARLPGGDKLTSRFWWDTK